MQDNNTDSTDEFFDRDQAARAAHQSLRTIDRWLGQPDGPRSFTVGRRRLIPRVEFMAWLRAHGEKP